MVKIAPSILSADFSKLGKEVERIDKAGADWIHIDVMDGQFVPNITFGAPVVKSLRNKTDKCFDVHLMIDEPGRFIDDFVNAGADMITVHYEADKHIDRTIQLIKSKGIKAGIALNPGTPTCMIKDLISEIDMVLIMSVNPGFGGQKFIPYTIEKVREINKLKEQFNKELIIEIDGGIVAANIKSVVEAGVNVAVAGSAVFKEDRVEENIKELKCFE